MTFVLWSHICFRLLYVIFKRLFYLTTKIDKCPLILTDYGILIFANAKSTHFAPTELSNMAGLAFYIRKYEYATLNVWQYDNGGY